MKFSINLDFVYENRDYVEAMREIRECGFQNAEIVFMEGKDLKRAVEDDTYIQYVKELLKKYDLECHALATHIIGQCVGDYDDPRLDNFAPPRWRASRMQSGYGQWNI